MALTRSWRALGAAALAVVFLAGCEGNYAADPNEPVPAPNVGRNARPDPDDTLFGEDGLTLGRILDGSLFGQEPEPGDRLPINRFLWQGSLETLDFLPLASTDPFTGVIATEWATTPENPAERFKVAAYVTSPELEASSLRVAVFRELRTEDGVWVPSPVSAETVRRLEDAILTRARQIRIAEIEAEQES